MGLNTEDKLNWSNTPLGISEVYTGSWMDTLHYASIIIGVKSDQASATNGLAIEWSADGITVVQDDVFTIPADTGKVFTFMPANRYYRIVYTNGAIAQTLFKLQCVLKSTGIIASSHRIQDSIVVDDDATLVKAILTGQDVNTGIFQNVQSFQQAMHVLSKSHEEFVAEGSGGGNATIRKFGHNTNVGTTYEDIAQFVYDYTISSAQPFEIVSTSDEDSASGGVVAEGDGARTVCIIGVDGSGNYQTEIIELDGTTVVTLVNSYLFINRLYCVLVGSTKVNVGDITLRTTAGATPASTTYGFIEIGEGQTLQSVYYVPNDYARLLLKSWGGGVDKSQDAALRLQTKKYALGVGGTEESWRTRDIVHLYQTFFSLDYQYSPMLIEPNSLVRIQGKASTGTNNVVTANFFGLEQLL